MLRLLRVRHWIKNLLILLPFFCSGQLLLSGDQGRCLLTGTLAFCFLCSSIYIINDMRDVEKDRAHPVKCHRPLASGAVSMTQAKVLLVLCLLLCCLLLLVGRTLWISWVYCAIYFVLNLVYNFGGKHVPVLDISILSAGYLLRILLGGSLTGTPVSSWLFLTILCFAFYFGLGKRRGELAALSSADHAPETRPVLKAYSLSYLTNHMYLCMGLGICFYSLWALEKSAAFLYTVPLVLVICMTYNLLLEKGGDGDPIGTLFSSKAMLALSCLYGLLMIGLFYFVR